MLTISILGSSTLLFRSQARFFSFVLATVSRIIDSGSNVPLWNLVEFGDPDVAHKITTYDAAQMKAAVQALRVYDEHGNTDFKESYMNGEHKKIMLNVKCYDFYFVRSRKSTICDPAEWNNLGLW